MAFEDYDDYEKSEHVVQWLRENAMAIVAGIALGLLLIFGANQWRTHTANHRAEAAAAYQGLQQAIAARNQTAIDAAIASLKDEYKDTPFAVFAAFREAELHVKADQPAQAVAPLKWAAHQASDAALKSLAQVRLAKVQLATGKAEDALATLKLIPKSNFVAMAEEVKGDALLILKRNDEARQAYVAALQAYDEGAPQRNLVQLKLDNLTVSGKQGS